MSNELRHFKFIGDLAFYIFTGSLIPTYYNQLLFSGILWAVCLGLGIYQDLLSPSGILSGPYEKQLLNYKVTRGLK